MLLVCVCDTQQGFAAGVLSSRAGGASRGLSDWLLGGCTHWLLKQKQILAALLLTCACAGPRCKHTSRATAPSCPRLLCSWQVIDQLGVRPTAPMRPGAAPAAAGPPRRQFILPLEDPACETSINNILTGV